MLIHGCAQATAARWPLLRFPFPHGRVAELADAQDSGSCVLDGTWGFNSPLAHEATCQGDLARSELVRGLALELEGRVRGVAHDPRLVARKDLVGVSDTDVELAPLIGDDVQAARDAIADVVGLARVGADERLDVGGPTPAWLERGLSRGRARQMDDVEPSV